MGSARVLVVTGLAAAAVLIPSCTVFNGLSADVSPDGPGIQSTSGGPGGEGGTGPAASHMDGVKDDGETDVDCGGMGDAPRCGDNKTCLAATDCTSGVCPSGTCAAPTGTDGVKNGDESDVDCGGTTTGAPKCAVGKTCAAHADCATDGCDFTMKCALGRSCTQQMGGVTCGLGEVGDPAATHESCCQTIPLSTGVKLGKYKVTAGRIRAMVERLNGDVKGWYQTNKATLSASAVAQVDPWVDMLPSALRGDTVNKLDVLSQLGAWIYIIDKPSAEQGCVSRPDAAGVHTYWFSDTDNAVDNNSPAVFTKDVLDTKPINCITMPMAAAFCAWDGGRLQTFAENKEMYGPSTYPYGATPAAGGFNSTGQIIGPATMGITAPLCPTCDTNQMNWHNNYQFPSTSAFDYAFYISPPGRWANDKGPLGHMDAGGDLIEHTGTDGMFTDDKGRTPTFKWGKQGSWEGHNPGNEGYSFTPMTKYGKTGVRCAYE